MDMFIMTRKFALLLLVAVLPFAGCDKIPFLKKKPKVDAAATPAPAAVAAAACRAPAVAWCRHSLLPTAVRATRKAKLRHLPRLP